MLVAAPSLATLGILDKDDEPGIFLVDIWDTSAVKVFGPAFDPEISHCPLLSAIEGIYLTIPNPTTQTYLDDPS
jgi:hypothetical protein